MGDAASPRRWGQHQREGLALRCRGISPRFVASSTCMGLPLTESPGQYRRTSGFTRGAHEGRTTCAALGACSNNDGKQERGIGCRPLNRTQDTLSRSIRHGAAGKVWRCTTGGAASSMASWTMPTRLKVGAEEAGNDRNAFCSATEQARRPREPVVHTLKERWSMG